MSLVIIFLRNTVTICLAFLRADFQQGKGAGNWQLAGHLRGRRYISLRAFIVMVFNETSIVKLVSHVWVGGWARAGCIDQVPSCSSDWSAESWTSFASRRASTTSAALNLDKSRTQASPTARTSHEGPHPRHPPALARELATRLHDIQPLPRRPSPPPFAIPTNTHSSP